jgi:hypothetical protein
MFSFARNALLWLATVAVKAPDVLARAQPCDRLVNPVSHASLQLSPCPGSSLNSP